MCCWNAWKYRQAQNHGILTHLADGTSAPRRNTIAATEFSAKRHAVKGSPTQSSFNISYITQPINYILKIEVIKAMSGISRLVLRGNEANDARESGNVSIKEDEYGILNNAPSEPMEKARRRWKQSPFKDPIPEPRVTNTCRHFAAITKEDVQQLQGCSSVPQSNCGQSYRWQAAMHVETRVRTNHAIKVRSGNWQDYCHKKSGETYQTHQSTVHGRAGAGGIVDDNPKPAVEYANEIFDEDSGKLMKYQATDHSPETQRGVVSFFR